MIELRCGNNRKAGEVDPATLSFTFKCSLCSDVQNRAVYHHWPLGRILNAIGAGLQNGVVYPAESETESNRGDVH